MKLFRRGRTNCDFILVLQQVFQKIIFSFDGHNLQLQFFANQDHIFLTFYFQAFKKCDKNTEETVINDAFFISFS
jgi:hypothetical protein